MTVMTRGLYERKAPKSPAPTPVVEGDPNALPLREITNEMLTLPGFTDLTGTKFGQSHVIGLALKAGRWLCECRCGELFERTRASIKKGLATTVPIDGCDRCNVCDWAMRAKRYEFYQFNERYPTDEEMRVIVKGLKQ